MRARLHRAAVTLAAASMILMSTGAITPAQSVAPQAAALAGCSVGRGTFVPYLVQAGGYNARVLAVARSGGVPGVAPLPSGKWKSAFDKPGIRPGSRYGHALLNAHSYPDNSALGDWWQMKLQVGAVIKVWNRTGSRVQCYRVVSRGEYRADRRTATWYYGNSTSAPRLAMSVCSGRRLGPGNYTHRTIWMAKPFR